MLEEERKIMSPEALRLGNMAIYSGVFNLFAKTGLICSAKMECLIRKHICILISYNLKANPADDGHWESLIAKAALRS